MHTVVEHKIQHKLKITHRFHAFDYLVDAYGFSVHIRLKEEENILNYI